MHRCLGDNPLPPQEADLLGTSPLDPLVAPVRESANGILVDLMVREGHQFSPSQADCAPVAGMLPASTSMQPDWRMGQSSDLVPSGMHVPGIRFRHPDQFLYKRECLLINRRWK
jgi:hypothetical protein